MIGKIICYFKGHLWQDMIVYRGYPLIGVDVLSCCLRCGKKVNT
jgi:hypothetical protein